MVIEEDKKATRGSDYCQQTAFCLVNILLCLGVDGFAGAKCHFYAREREREGKE